MCVFLLLWDRRGRFTRPSAFADYGQGKYIHWLVFVHHQFAKIAQCNAADDAHNHEKDGDANRELKERLFKSAPRALNRFTTTAKLAAKCRAFGLQQQQEDEHHRNDDHHDIDRDTHG